VSAMNRRIARIFLILIAVLVSPALVLADQVTPSDRVTSHVNVRQLPTSESSIVGTLGVGENAQLLDSVPYWHKISLTDGTEGFVSKAWTEVITDAGEITPSSGKTDLIIGSWNIKWFGYYTADKHDYPRIVEIIQKFDVVAIQELCGKRYKDRLEKLINELSQRGFKYSYIVSEETGYKDHPDENHPTEPKSDYLERYAFLWDIDRVELINPTVSFRFVKAPRINNDTFRQVPVVADFKVKSGNGFDFRILTIHTVYNDDINNVRRAETQFVHDWIIDQITRSSNQEKNIIAIGDFNANPENKPHHFNDIIAGPNSFRVLLNEPLKAGEPPLRTTTQRTNHPDSDYFEFPVYDHALVSNETSYALPHSPMTRAANDLGIVEFDQEEHWQQLGDWNVVIRAMSDHRPIWFRKDYMAEDRD
jgi:endonuclease/exonuclease/phosphatase family metal-dependent hydrolase